MSELDEIYGGRFSDTEAARRALVWRELARFLQRYVDPNATVLDLACDRGDFIRHIGAGAKWATDVRDVRPFLPPNVTFVQGDGLALDTLLPADHFDVVFMSNYLEHLPSRNAVVTQLRVALRLLKPGGRVLVLQPNIRLIGGAYWDFIDHRVALTEKSLTEAAEVAGYRTAELITRFLPYTTKSRFPQQPGLVRLYLKLRPAWFIFGKQSLYVGERPRTQAAGQANPS